MQTKSYVELAASICFMFALMFLAIGQTKSVQEKPDTLQGIDITAGVFVAIASILIMYTMLA